MHFAPYSIRVYIIVCAKMVALILLGHKEELILDEEMVPIQPNDFYSPCT